MYVPPINTVELVVIHKLSHLISRIAFVLLSTTIISVFLFFAWICDIDSKDTLNQFQSMAQYLPFQSTWSVLSFFGISGASLLAGYYWAFQKIYWKIAIPFLFSNIEVAEK